MKMDYKSALQKDLNVQFINNGPKIYCQTKISENEQTELEKRKYDMANIIKDKYDITDVDINNNIIEKKIKINDLFRLINKSIPSKSKRNMFSPQHLDFSVIDTINNVSLLTATYKYISQESMDTYTYIYCKKCCKTHLIREFSCHDMYWTNEKEFVHCNTCHNTYKIYDYKHITNCSDLLIIHETNGVCPLCNKNKSHVVQNFEHNFSHGPTDQKIQPRTNYYK